VLQAPSEKATERAAKAGPKRWMRAVATLVGCPHRHAEAEKSHLRPKCPCLLPAKV
jgi:hypothetical protein